VARTPGPGGVRHIVRSTLAGLAIVVALALPGSPRGAEGQAAPRIYRIGMLETRSAGLNVANIDAFRQGLREFGTSKVRTS
jgi:hypothetical protein